MAFASEASLAGTSYEATLCLRDTLHSLQLKSGILVSQPPNVSHAFLHMSVAGLPIPSPPVGALQAPSQCRDDTGRLAGDGALSHGERPAITALLPAGRPGH